MPDALPTRAAKILALLERAYPDATCALIYRNPLELMVATILSAQCTDVLVNKVTPALFKRYKSAKDFAKAPLEQLEGDLSRVNFYRNKAKSIKAACQLLVDEYGGKVPKTMDELIKLPGVGRKTANVILGNAFKIEAGGDEWQLFPERFLDGITSLGYSKVQLGDTQRTDMLYARPTALVGRELTVWRKA